MKLRTTVTQKNFIRIALTAQPEDLFPVLHWETSASERTPEAIEAYLNQQLAGQKLAKVFEDKDQIFVQFM